MKSLFDFVSEFQPGRPNIRAGLDESLKRVQQHPHTTKRPPDIIPDALRVMANRKHGFIKACNLALDAVRDNPEMDPETGMVTALLVGIYNTIPRDASPNFGWLPEALRKMDHEFPLQASIGTRAANMVCDMLDDISVIRPVELVLRGEMLIAKIYPLESPRRTEAINRIIFAVRTDRDATAPVSMVKEALRYVVDQSGPNTRSGRLAEALLEQRASSLTTPATDMEDRAVKGAAEKLTALITRFVSPDPSGLHR